VAIQNQTDSENKAIDDGIVAEVSSESVDEVKEETKAELRFK